MGKELEIELRNITKVFGSVVAVNDVDVKIKFGEFFSLLGPSGCGKTTTLRMIAGLEKPTRGRIFLFGNDVTDTPAYLREVNTVFQDYAIFPHMNVYENIYFPLKMRKISKDLAHPKIVNIMKLVNMGGFEKRYSSQLSGGQRQRIALARALVNEPRALLLDEPLGALDFKLRVAMQNVLKDIQRRLSITFVYVTHDQTEAITMSDRIAVMKDGLIHQIGTPEEIYNDPKTAFVASFIGEMNFLNGKVEKISSDTIDVLVANQKIQCKSPDIEMAQGDDVLVCVRPEKIHINPSSKMHNVLKTKISRVVFRGDDYEITSIFNDSSIRSVVGYTTWDKSHTVGTEIKIGWEAFNSIVYPLNMQDDIVKYA
ncbi:MAG: ABC transporter ATP-binding protein [Spirochaetota bacterium]|nr:MAG: ABC transporter ATP-binding protein [Spirochaetota bacterium]